MSGVVSCVLNEFFVEMVVPNINAQIRGRQNAKSHGLGTFQTYCSVFTVVSHGYYKSAAVTT
jgi:hypothetical protein